MSSAAFRHPSLLDASHLHFGDYLSGERDMEDQRRRLVHAAFLRHVQENADFARYAGQVARDDLDDPDILYSANMPLLPSSLFKRDDLSIRSVDADAIVKRCLSSGTSGSVSRVDRDEATLLNFVTTITAALPPLFALDRTGDYAAIVLGPSTEDVGDLWFSYVISCLGLMMPTTYCEIDGLFDAENGARVTREHIARGEPYVLIGPPHRIVEVSRLVGPLERPSQPRSFAISAGGWKGLEAESIPPAAFRTLVTSSLRLESESQVRDNFNMVELNTVLFECEHHRKHLPPWLLVQARDPDTNAVLPSGSTGILSFMDAGAVSYPCFILGEDFGSVDRSICSCGRHGGTVTVLRRINRVEQRGCALKMSGARSADDHSSDRFHTSVYRR
jgi:long-chain-fatty-acid---luciferin-component ligase